MLSVFFNYNLTSLFALSNSKQRQRELINARLKLTNIGSGHTSNIYGALLCR